MSARPTAATTSATSQPTVNCVTSGAAPPRLAAVVTPRDDAGAALDELTSRDVNELPVVEDGRLSRRLARHDIQRRLELHGEQAA